MNMHVPKIPKKCSCSQLGTYGLRTTIINQWWYSTKRFICNRFSHLEHINLVFFMQWTHRPCGHDHKWYSIPSLWMTSDIDVAKLNCSSRSTCIFMERWKGGGHFILCTNSLVGWRDSYKLGHCSSTHVILTNIWISKLPATSVTLWFFIHIICLRVLVTSFIAW